MKKLYVHQQLNSEYRGPEHTPELDRYVYVVDKVINSTSPTIMDSLTKGQVDELCEADDWKVTVS